jgi:hypothetical protein
LIIDILTEVKWNLSVVLICISFMGKNVEHFFMYLLVNCSSFENCLPVSFAHRWKDHQNMEITRARCWWLMPVYSGGRDQEDCGSKPAWANSLQDPMPKKPITKKGWWSGSSVDPEFKPQY